MIVMPGNVQLRRNRKGKQRRRNKKGFLFVLPSLAGIMVFYFLPYIDVIRRSFAQAASGRFAGLDNYLMVINNEAFRLAFINTFKLIAVCVPVLTALSLTIAVLIRNGIDGKEIWKKGLLVPMAVPVAAVVLIWKAVFENSGFLNGLLHLAGGLEQDWMSGNHAFAVLVFSYVWKNLGYSIILWLAGLSAVPKEIYEAARVDGAGDWICFWKITVPNIMSSFFMILVLSMINCFKVFREAYLVAGDYPDQSIYMLQHLFNNWFRDLEVDKMSAGAVINGVVLFVFIWIFWKLWERKE